MRNPPLFGRPCNTNGVAAVLIVFETQSWQNNWPASVMYRVESISSRITTPLQNTADREIKRCENAKKKHDRLIKTHSVVAMKRCQIAGIRHYQGSCSQRHPSPIRVPLFGRDVLLKVPARAHLGSSVQKDRSDPK